MQRISTVLEAWLVAQGMSVGSAGTGDTQGMGAGLPRRKDTPATAQAQGEDASRSGMGKAGAAKAPASALEWFGINAQEPSPDQKVRPVLILLQGGSNRPSRKSNVRLRLVLTT